MKKKMTILALSFAATLVLMPAGFGSWYDNVTILGLIRIIPNPDIIAEMEAELDMLEIQMLEAKKRIQVVHKQDSVVEMENYYPTTEPISVGQEGDEVEIEIEEELGISEENADAK
ncbi:MAG: hypothetical protein WCZ27_08960 [Tissierellaceae bacterium]